MDQNVSTLLSKLADVRLFATRKRYEKKRDNTAVDVDDNYVDCRPMVTTVITTTIVNCAVLMAIKIIENKRDSAYSRNRPIILEAVNSI